jgi:hypothetical protein
MANYAEKLISIGSEPLVDKPPNLNQNLLNLAGSVAEGLYKFLSKKNGFIAFESALHVFPSNVDTNLMTLEMWNSDDLWRKDYGNLTENCLFFAEDIFGVQFCIFESKIYSFDPETGTKELLATDIEQWSKAILEDFNMLTGFPLAHEWQLKHGNLTLSTINKRLLPKIPFFCGGKFEVDNLYLADSVKGMKLRAEIALQTRNTPDGTKIKFHIVS